MLKQEQIDYYKVKVDALNQRIELVKKECRDIANEANISFSMTAHAKLSLPREISSICIKQTENFVINSNSKYAYKIDNKYYLCYFRSIMSDGTYIIMPYMTCGSYGSQMNYSGKLYEITGNY